MSSYVCSFNYGIESGDLRTRLPLYALLLEKPTACSIVALITIVRLWEFLSATLYPVTNMTRYMRPFAVLLRNPPHNSATAVSILVERGRAVTNQQNWFYIDESVETNLELIEVYPAVRWDGGVLISTENDLTSDIILRSFARFRRKDDGSRDVIIETREHYLATSKHFTRSPTIYGVSTVAFKIFSKPP